MQAPVCRFSAFGAAALASACLAPVASADSVSFEELGVRPPAFIETNPLRSEYSGLTFAGPGKDDGGAILNQQGGFGFGARSGEHFLAFNHEAVMQNGGTPRGPEQIIFAQLAMDVEIYANGFDADFRLDALDVAGGIIGSFSASANGQWTRLFFSSDTPIQAVILSVTNDATAYAYDDLNYNVPAPGALSIAVVGLLASRRRR